jgi:hypothetical protein
LATCARENVGGFGTTYTYYDEKMVATKVDIQVNLL